jgi:Ca2+:H+ antiporter
VRAGPAVGRVRGDVLPLLVAAATILVTVAAEIVASSVEEAGRSLDLSSGFLGFIVLPLVGNAAEQFSALALAAKNRLDVAADIAVGASIQLVMLVVPVLVLVGILAGHSFSLVFDALELAVLVVGTLLVRQLVEDRRAHWFEGAMLLGLYASFGAAAFFVEV